MTDDPTDEAVEVQFRWRAAPFALAVATCSAGALAVAMIGPQWNLLVFAAPLLGVLASAGFQRRATSVWVLARPRRARCFETETVRVGVEVQAEGPVELRVTADPALVIDVVERRREGSTVDVCAQRWGRYPMVASVRGLAPGGLFVREGEVEVAELTVFPLAPPQGVPMPRSELLDRIGIHLTRRVGSGVEYADIRPYVPGDHLRSINWRVSARRGHLHVTERLTERSADVVVLLDTYPQPPGPATEVTERTARGAVQVVQSALRNGDRAGIVTLGGARPRWLGADIGRQQFYRVLDAVLSSGERYEPITGTLAPKAAIPPGAIVVAFSTLLDTDFALALIDLCKRGHIVVAVDVLDRAPFDDQRDPLITRMWSLQRSFMYRDMRVVGVDVVPWDSDNTLDQALHLMPGRR